jgi:hypothetical protein
MSKPFFETLIWEDLFDGLPHMVPNGGMVRPDGTTKPVYDELSAVRKQLVPGAKAASPAGGKRRR